MIWLDGKLVPADAAALRADDGAYRSGHGCYTTARFDAGRVRFGERSARRLARDAAHLGLGELDPAACLGAMIELGAAAFGDGEGALRFQASCDGDGQLHLVGQPRALGPEPARWRGRCTSFSHPGPAPWGGAKVTGQLRLHWAREHARELGLDELLLFDHAGRLVEGARSNVFVVRRDGALVTPDLERGAVAGVVRQILLEQVAELNSADLDRDALAGAREILVTNALRGVRPLVELDGAAVGSGAPGPWAARLEAALAAADADDCATEEAEARQ